MKVHVVIRFAMSGSDAVGVVSTSHAADQLVKDFVGQYEVREVEVLGDVSVAGQVYAAGKLDKIHDIHQFVGIFGNREAAHKAAGEQGMVLPFEVK